MNKITRFAILALFIILQSCANYTTTFNTMEDIQDPNAVKIKEGRACSKNLFGGFSLPWIGDTAIKLSGDQSVATAIKNAGISHVYAVDHSVLHYVFYSKRCTIVFGY